MKTMRARFQSIMRATRENAGFRLRAAWLVALLLVCLLPMGTVGKSLASPYAPPLSSIQADPEANPSRDSAGDGNLDAMAVGGIYVNDQDPVGPNGVWLHRNQVPVCGNGITEPGEACDGRDLNGYTCSSVEAGFVGGPLSCTPDCSDYNGSQCIQGNTIAATAANHYVRAGAMGDGTGVDWTHAYTDLPTELVRGDTYYVADGNYSSYVLDDTISDTLIITIRKATSLDHGTEKGWQDSYGDDQAVFTPPFNIIRSYVTFDGNIGSGSNPDSYGFRIATPTECNQANRMFGVPGVGYSSVPISNVIISHVAMINCGSAYDYPQIGIYSVPLTATNLTISNNYIKDNSTNMLFVRWSNCSIRDNYFAGNWSSPANHGTQLSPSSDCDCDDIVLKNNVFKDSHGTAAVSVHKADNDRWKVYNNLIVGGVIALGIGTGDSLWLDVVKNWEFHHNTFVDVQLGEQGAFFVGNLTNPSEHKSYAHNNLFYNCSHPNFENRNYTEGAIVHTHNAHYDSSGIYDGDENGTAQDETGNPFVDSVNGDYRLTEGTAAIDTGTPLSNDYRIDILGNQRPQGSGWDMGAYEFVPQLELHGAPADQAIHLTWSVNTTLPVTSTWQIDYEGPIGDQTPPITGIVSPTRAYTLTGLTNYAWYTVTLGAMLDSAPLLTDTVCVMPTDIAVYLPLVSKED